LLWRRDPIAPVIDSKIPTAMTLFAKAVAPVANPLADTDAEPKRGAASRPR
jgi:hypothetical protein